jgi:hypothetical protein
VEVAVRGDEPPARDGAVLEGHRIGDELSEIGSSGELCEVRAVSWRREHRVDCAAAGATAPGSVRECGRGAVG